MKKSHAENGGFIETIKPTKWFPEKIMNKN